MATRYENLTTPDNDTGSVYGAVWNMQSFTPSLAHQINSVKLKLWRVGSPGTLTVGIRETSGGVPTGSDLVTGVINGNTLPADTAGTWTEIILGSGQTLSASTMYSIVIRATTGSFPNHYVGFRMDSGGSAYTSGSRRYSTNSGASWEADTVDDILFEEWSGYGGSTPAAPIVSTEQLTSITNTTATGNGTIVDIGAASVTEHGHCWATAVNPTTADSKTTNGAGTVGSFTSSLTGLTAGQKYYVRAYATNSSGTGYGGNISFLAGYPGSQKIGGEMRVKGTTLRYMGEDGIEYYIQGVVV